MLNALIRLLIELLRLLPRLALIGFIGLLAGYLGYMIFGYSGGWAWYWLIHLSWR